MGPFALMDLIGIDVNLAANEGVWRGFNFDPRYAPTALQREMVAAGRLGRKTGRGYYDYGPEAPPPAPLLAPPAPAPGRIVLRGDLGPARPLAERIAASGLALARADGAPAILVDDYVLAPTDGRPATLRRAAGEAVDAVFDQARDWASASHTAVALAEQADEGALTAAAGLFQALGIAVAPLGDGPGLIALRTLATIANEATSAVETGVCAAADLDLAMMKGTGWPAGPLAWAEAHGLAHVLAAVDNLAATFRNDRYRAQPLLQRAVAAGRGIL
jgi:3-hydroxybutyryl-CoA dehydrogenase